MLDKVNRMLIPSGRGQARSVATKYDGKVFRSQLEARWAMFFDLCGLVWKYEPAMFVSNSTGLQYVPDFYLRDSNNRAIWIEIKGREPTSREIMKCTILGECQFVPVPVVLLWGGFCNSNRQTWGKFEPDDSGELGLFAKWVAGGNDLTSNESIIIASAYEAARVNEFEKAKRRPNRIKKWKIITLYEPDDLHGSRL